MPERVELAGLDEQEVLRRLKGPEGPGPGAPDAVAAAAAVRPVGVGTGNGGFRPGAFPRGMVPASFMAMQRLAGNRAMVQALGRSAMPAVVQALDDDLDEKASAGGAPPAEASAQPGQAGAAPGAPGAGAAPGAPGAGSGSGGAAGFAMGGVAGAVAGALGAGLSAVGGAAEGVAGAFGIGSPAGGAAGTAGSMGAGNAAAGPVLGGVAGAVAGALGTGLSAVGGAAEGLAGAFGIGSPAGGAAGTAGSAGAGLAAGGAAGAAAGAAGSVGAGSSAIGGAAGAAGTTAGAAGAGAGAGAGAATGGAGAGAAGAAAGTARPRRSAPPPISGGAPSGAGAGGTSRTGPATGGAGVAAAAGSTGAGLADGAGAATASGGTSNPETAKTGIDWSQMLSDFGPPARTVLEIGRLIPGWGLLAGLASDSLSFASDLSSIPTSKNARFATDLIIFRNFVNIGNNALGHVLYVNQLIQDGLAGSVVGAEFTPLTAAANEVLSGIKVALDEVQLGTDIVVEVEAIYEANHAPDSAEAEKWRQLADGYAANILGDVVNTVLDVISLASAGAANTAPIEEAKLPLTLAGAFLEHAAPNIISAINNVLGVWLGSGVTAGRHAATGQPAAGAGAGTAAGTGAGTAAGSAGPAPAATGAGVGGQAPVQRIGEGLPGVPGGRGSQAARLRTQAVAYDMAGNFVTAEAPIARATYDGIDAVIDAFEEYASDQVAQIDAVVGALTGGKSAFQVIRDAVTAGLNNMNAKVAMAQQLAASATNAQATAKSISAGCDSLLGSIDALVMPSVHIPSVDLGEGVIAGAASAVVNTAAEAANAAIELAISGVSAALDTAKDAVRAPILDIKAHADDIAEWLAILATKCTEMIATLHAHIASFSEGLGHCNNVGDVIDLIIGQVSDLTGMPRFTVQDMRNTWAGVAGYIDQFAALGPQLHDQATALRAQADELDAGAGAGPTFALPPGPPATPGLGAGAAA